MDEDRVYLTFTTRILDLISMWNTQDCFWNTIKGYYVLMILIVSTMAIFADFFLQFYDEEINFTSVIETLIGGAALLSVIYAAICYIVKRDKIKDVIKSLKTFEKYLPEEEIQAAEDSAKFYTKTFIIYGIIGNTLYDILPFFAVKECDVYRSRHMTDYGIACKVIVRYVLPFKYDYSPLHEMVVFEQMAVAILGTIVIMSITMIVGGILTHLSANLQHLNGLIADLSNLNGTHLEKQVHLCVKYHTEILSVAEETNNAFSVMMLVHITWTSFIISVLGFEIITDKDYWNTIRFTMHLGGWLMMLFLVCVYGQMLINQSSDIAEAVYNVRWYKKPPKIRQHLVLILIRAQRASVLKAAGVNVMSLSTFIGVLYSAYSYFTLLVKIKP